MPIISSMFQLDAHAQSDGTRWCKELHTLEDGTVIPALYKLKDGMDADAIMAARAATINDQLAEAEADQVLRGS